MRRRTQAVAGHEPAGARPQDAHRLRGDLETVIAKALRKAPEDRYPTMAAFIADLENWLEHRPVSAGPDDWRYRSRLWLRRNRNIALLSAAALILLGAGLTISLLQLRRALAAEARAGIAAAEARRSAEYAELRREFAFGLLEAGNVGATGASAATEISLQMLDLAAARIDKSFDGQPFLRAQMRGEIAALYGNRHPP